MNKDDPVAIAETKIRKVLLEIETLARRNFLPIIGPEKGKYLADTVKQFKPHNILEVGTLIGYSAILMAGYLPDDEHIYTIEINPDSARKAKENILRAELSHRITVITGDALEIIPALHQQFEMIFLDAEKNEYLAYLKRAEPLLKKNSVVFADNAKIFAGAMRDYLEYVRLSGKYSSKFLDVGFDGVEISIKLF